ncbi:hypothetical protein U8607_10635 [Methylobacterium durans]|uniref:hypothetical protein n=1 Tax=Methylobacterium durans TaxID=2202825 RepID=UPI002AFDEF42|nr:hypothetical protein [Methylobacterium durans]MEA1832539.1 hypothetical protein [Methylobacterium durans]
MSLVEDFANLLTTGAIVRIDVSLGPSRLPMRQLYGTSGFILWLEDRMLHQATSAMGAEATPFEQLDELFYRYISGTTLIHRRDFRCIKPEKNPVWEMKTPDLRIFGWFPMKDCFIAVFGDWADHVKDYDLYRGYRLEVRRLRRQMDLDEKWFGKGGAPDEVISS